MARCFCGHAESAHRPGVACRRCECDFYVVEPADEVPEPDFDEGYEIGVRERMYERWLDRIAP